MGRKQNYYTKKDRQVQHNQGNALLGSIKVTEKKQKDKEKEEARAAIKAANAVLKETAKASKAVANKANKAVNNTNKNYMNNNMGFCAVQKKSKFDYTRPFEAVLLDISSNISFSLLSLWHNQNEYSYKLLDLSYKKDTFRIQKDFKNETIVFVKVQDFINNLFPGKFHPNEINEFVQEYNKRNVPKEKEDIDYYVLDNDRFSDENFIYNPTDIFNTFCSLCHKTYPHGTEELVLKYMPVPNLKKDLYGNYYVKIGESDVMFTSHLDSAWPLHEEVSLLNYVDKDDLFVISNGKTIISADDKAGVTIMLYMIHHNIPGLYYFFLGEERGGIGSGLVAANYDRHDYLKGINKCVSFDRRNYNSVITHQGSRRSCSDVFALSLCSELNKNGMQMSIDNTGLFTDSANFIDHIVECTNVSVGYFNEHTVDEYQNITFLEELCEACIKVDWANLEVNKQSIISKAIINKNKEFLSDLQKLRLFCDSPSLKSYESSPNSVFLEFNFKNSFLKMVLSDIKDIERCLDKHNLFEVKTVFLEDGNNILFNIELN